MIAELHSKISSSGSNLSDRLEDKLTGDVFGALRYLPFASGLLPVLQKVRIRKESGQRKFADWVPGLTLDPATNIYKFWPWHKEGEIDLLLDFPDCLIGIEVKFLSGLSSRDNGEGTSDVENSQHQLAREARMLRELSRNRPAWLIYLTRQGQANAEVDELLKLENGQSDIGIGTLYWTDVLEALQEAKSTLADPYQTLILSDLIWLLSKKGFVRFVSFEKDLPQVTITENHFSFAAKQVQFDFNTSQNINKDGYFRYAV